MSSTAIPDLQETAITILNENSRILGKLTLGSVARVHGEVVGELHAGDGSTVILAETSVIEGTIYADTLFVDGFVRGDIHARTRVVLSSTGRVVGNIRTPSLQVEFGSYFEGECLTRDPAPTPA